MLGIKVTQNGESITLDQQHFTEALLEQYGMADCRPSPTPLVTNEHLIPVTSKEILKLKELKINFRSAVGRINYLSSATRPDLSFAVSTLLHYLECPGIRHWHAFLHVLRYLKARRSVTGFLATFHGCLILWKKQKQPSVSTSTAEAEYKALCDLTSELLWLKQWCQEANLFVLAEPITVWDDNQSCINTSNGNCNFNKKRMKHVDIQLHFIKEVVKSATIMLKYTPSSEMLADYLTKSVRAALTTAANPRSHDNDS
ncbi:hypothetical protein O181_091871 [Austropuccinia psidii MF-1]|uniref:Reverse transcriptase Ty1/copia-type domain-containing protein n=1 Tax=Austropuccinia psidii MF-1 TaxID=1389203 RepID=A0A9Q3PA25_9BASI|nr:hypothetical protein [Austropuccinia psidii MF-1]